MLLPHILSLNNYQSGFMLSKKCKKTLANPNTGSDSQQLLSAAQVTTPARRYNGGHTEECVIQASCTCSWGKSVVSSATQSQPMTHKSDSDTEIDRYESKSQEDFDLDILDATTDDLEESGSSCQSDETDVETRHFINNCPNLKPEASHAPPKWKKPAGSIGKGKGLTKPASFYDPQNCSFMIQCEISSTISLDSLCIAVAEKYWLDSDKAKAGSLSIQTDEELDMFKGQMRLLIVPAHLANGKPSTCPLKNVLVYFEDAGREDVQPSHMSTNKGNKAVSWPSSKQKPSSGDGGLEGMGQQEELIQALQE
ncbi:hypothetical protein EDC04DRAFT_2616087 [Pisolithus marmoratus]|nr:hypothetical protein EDC04DRAFT_2616087 [Pisolithus marmoratus]